VEDKSYNFEIAYEVKYVFIRL